MRTGDNVRSDIYIIHRSVMKAETWKYKYADSFVTHKMKLSIMFRQVYIDVLSCLCSFTEINANPCSDESLD